MIHTAAHSDVRPGLSEDQTLATSVLSRHSWVSGWPARALTYLAMLPPAVALSSFFGKENEALAANVPAREVAVSNFANNSWQALQEAMKDPQKLQALPNTESLWNNVQAALHVSDKTALPELDNMRSEIIRQGATNPHIPARVVHGALYTTAVLGQELNQQILKNQEELKNLRDASRALEQMLASVNSFSPSFKDQAKEQKKSIDERIKLLESESAVIMQRKVKLSDGVLAYLGKNILMSPTLTRAKSVSLSDDLILRKESRVNSMTARISISLQHS